MVEGLSHITFVVGNLERSGQMLQSVLGAEEVYSSKDRMFSVAPERFYRVGGVWIALMQGEPLSERTYNHVALKVSDTFLDGCEQKIRDAGLDFQRGRPRIAGEGRSVYFHDYDNHLFELHTGTLEQRLDTYARCQEQSDTATAKGQNENNSR